MDEKDGKIGLALKYNKGKGKGKGAITNNAVVASSGFNRGSVDGVQSKKKSSGSGSHKIVNLDGSGSDNMYYDDDYADMYYGSMQADDSQLYNDDYAFLQSQFDNIDIPPGVEAPVPWFVSPGQNITNVATINGSNQPIPKPQHSPGGISLGTSHLSWSVDPWGQLSAADISATKAPVHVASHPYQGSMSSSWSTAENGLAASSGWGLNNISTFSGVANSHVIYNTPVSAQQYPPGFLPFFSSNFIPESISKTVGGNSVLLGPYMHNATEVYPFTTEYFNGNIMYQMASPEDPTDFNPFFTDPVSFGEVAYETSVPDSPPFPKDSVDLGISTSSSSKSHQNATTQPINEDEIVKRFQQFKKFDIVQDPSDHHYVHNGTSLKQPLRSWSKKIQEEWKILEKDLPDTIYVRAYESRMDLLRAVIIGAEGTPYHDGLFFFDVFFPDNYPNVPPQVYYHSRGLRLNPNLYNNGKVCLSLLNTWSGSQKEMWIPKLSTMLQVLVSIQGLILNAKPYFNEPAYANTGSTPQGIQSSDHYNERTFILSLKTMVFTLRKPPKNFEDFVLGHFFTHAQAILVACKAYMEGAQVGCLVRGGVQDVDEGDKSCSQQFKVALGQYLKQLADAFTKIGVKDCQQYIPPPQSQHTVKGQNRPRKVGSKVMSPALKPVHYFA